MADCHRRGQTTEVPPLGAPGGRRRVSIRPARAREALQFYRQITIVHDDRSVLEWGVIDRRIVLHNIDSFDRFRRTSMTVTVCHALYPTYAREYAITGRVA